MPLTKFEQLEQEVAALKNAGIDVSWGEIDGTLTDQSDLNTAINAAKSRSNHTGTQSADTIVDGTINKAYTASDKTKLTGIASGATANATDAQLRDRSTHTGSQSISTVTGLQSALDAKVGEGASEILVTAVDTVPVAPNAGEAKFYADDKFSKIIAAFRTPGDNFRLQPHFSDGHIAVAQPSNSATWTWFGAANVLSTGNAAAVRSASHFGQQHRISYTTSTTAGDIAHMRNNGLYFYRGNAAGLGGWLWRQKAGVRLAVAGMQIFLGFRSNGSAPVSVNPSTLTNICGFGKDATDSNWQFIVNAGSGTATKVDLGAAFPATTQEADWYIFTHYCEPNGTGIYWHARNDTDNVEASGFVNTTLPVNTTFLAWQNWISNGATAAFASIDIGTLYIETPY